MIALNNGPGLEGKLCGFPALFRSSSTSKECPRKWTLFSLYTLKIIFHWGKNVYHETPLLTNL